MAERSNQPEQEQLFLAETSNKPEQEQQSSSVYYNQDDDDHQVAAAITGSECDSCINNNNNEDKLTQQVPQTVRTRGQTRKRKFEPESDSPSPFVHVASDLSDNIRKIENGVNAADINNCNGRDAEKKVIITRTSIAEEEEDDEASKSRRTSNSNGPSEVEEESSKKVYKCKACDNAFNSYQALGGHMAGHNFKKRSIKLDNVTVSEKQGGGDGDKVYACNQCVKTFPTGQALGGHKSFHRFSSTNQVNDSQLRNYQLHSNNTNTNTNTKTIIRLFGYDISDSPND